MTNSASLAEMHRTRVSLVRRCACTQNLVLKIDRGTFSVCNIKNKRKQKTNTNTKTKNEIADCTPVFLVHCFAIY